MTIQKAGSKRTGRRGIPHLLPLLVCFLFGALGLMLSACSSPSDGRNPMPAPKRVVFVCVENSNRSQMAQAFARLHGGGRVEAFSAGSRPSGKVNPKAVAAMRELGYDLTAHQSKGLDNLPDVEFDAA